MVLRQCVKVDGKMFYNQSICQSRYSDTKLQMFIGLVFLNSQGLSDQCIMNYDKFKNSLKY